MEFKTACIIFERKIKMYLSIYLSLSVRSKIARPEPFEGIDKCWARSIIKERVMGNQNWQVVVVTGGSNHSKKLYAQGETKTRQT